MGATAPTRVTARSPYETLGLTEQAPPDVVRRAHRRLVRRYHPDRNSDPGAAEAFLAVQAAYEALATDFSADPDANVDPQRVAAEAERAAAEARRRRAPGGLRKGEWSTVAAELDRTAAERASAALGQPVGRAGVVVAVSLAALSVVVLPVAVSLGLAVVGFIAAVRAAAPPPATVEAHWDGLRDRRWDVRIGWDEVAAAEARDGALDLTLAPPAAGRLRAGPSAAAFVGGDVYRLPLAEPGPFGDLVRARVRA